MKLWIVPALLVAVLIGMVIAGRWGERGKRERKSPTTTKRVVWFCLGNGVAWVWCSYILAYLGRAEIAESLSKVALTEIVAVVLTYSIKSLFENLSTHNDWPDKPKKETPVNDDRDA